MIIIFLVETLIIPPRHQPEGLFSSGDRLKEEDDRSRELYSEFLDEMKKFDKIHKERRGFKNIY